MYFLIAKHVHLLLFHRYLIQFLGFYKKEKIFTTQIQKIQKILFSAPVVNFFTIHKNFIFKKKNFFLKLPFLSLDFNSGCAFQGNRLTVNLNRKIIRS